MASERTLELSRAINDEKLAWDKLRTFASQMNGMRGSPSSIEKELQELAILAVRAHERVDRVSKYGREVKEEEKTINRLEGILDLTLRIAHGETDDFLAADYGGLGYDQHATVRSVYALRDHIAWDLREAGWSVAVHNDYKQDGTRYTFWLFTHPDGRYVKGEGRTDADALTQVREQIWPKEKKP